MLYIAAAANPHLQPKLSLSSLPDGSAYRELRREALPAREIEFLDQKILYWGEVEENRLYTAKTATGSFITSSLKLLEGSVLQKQAYPEEIVACAGSHKGVITGLMVWRESMPGMNWSVPVVMAEVRENGTQIVLLCSGKLK